MLDVSELLAGCARHGVTYLDLPAAYWHELVYVLTTGSVGLPEGLRTVMIYGEAALPERVAQWRSLVGTVSVSSTGTGRPRPPSSPPWPTSAATTPDPSPSAGRCPASAPPSSTANCGCSAAA
ncbi:hypothetical protein O1L60_01150 [Streptomyces diastatochromogenes]|nr:hypothetical protein [Streptomyces diastatochromogenes]